jgi:DNA-binding transcriptional LysR family regulator
MELRLLRYFIAVAEDLHFTRAAARLHISQPSLSHEIRALERTLGTPLFRRTRRWVKLTEAGALLLSEARAIVERTEEARRRVARAGRGEIGQLNVGFAMSAAGDLLPNAVLAYRARFPEVNVHIRELTTTEQIDALLTDELEVGLVHEVAMPPGLRAVAVRRDTLVAALPSGHHLAKRARIALLDLKPELFVVGPGQSHHFVVSACASAGFVPQISQETSDTVTCLVLVASGVGVTLLPSSSGHLATRSVVYRPLSGSQVSHQLLVAWKPDRASPLTAAFVEILRKTARDLRKSVKGAH